MDRLNLSKIIKQNSLKKNEIATLLFPENKFPMAALTRVLNGEAHLDSVQISRLALFLNVTPGHLFSESQFYGYADNYQNLIFEKDNYVAKLNRLTWLTQIFCKGSLVHETIIHSGSQPLSTYLEELDNIIETLKTK